MSVFILSPEGEQTGPFDARKIAADVVAGKRAATALGWTEGEADWQPLSDLLAYEIQELESEAEDRREAEEEARATLADFRAGLTEAWRELYDMGEVVAPRLSKEQRQAILKEAKQGQVELCNLEELLAAKFPELLVPGYVARKAEEQRWTKFQMRTGEFAPVVRVDKLPPRMSTEKDVTSKQIDYLRSLGFRNEVMMERLGVSQARALITAILKAKGERNQPELGAQVTLQDSPATVAFGKQRKASPRAPVLVDPDKQREPLLKAAQTHLAATRGTIVKKSETFGVGSLVQIIGIVLGLALGFPFGLIVFILLLIIGSSMATHYRCSLCGTKVADRKVVICPGCRCGLSKK